MRSPACSRKSLRREIMTNSPIEHNDLTAQTEERAQYAVNREINAAVAVVFAGTVT